MLACANNQSRPVWNSGGEDIEGGVEPDGIGEGVWTELLGRAEIVMGKDGAVTAQGARGGRVDQGGGIGPAHLQEDPRGKLAEGSPIDGAFQGDEGVAPEDDVHGTSRTLPEERGELIGR